MEDEVTKDKKSIKSVRHPNPYSFKLGRHIFHGLTFSTRTGVEEDRQTRQLAPCRENEMHYNRGLMDNNGRKNSIKLIGLPPKVFIKSDTIPTTLVYFRPSSSSAFL
uniref:Uncharacterized protein n=1 Tax=Glossina pallidipes TaxID=7398 RepID=A0A1A9Z2U9_GLOPL